MGPSAATGDGQARSHLDCGVHIPLVPVPQNCRMWPVGRLGYVSLCITCYPMSVW